MDKYYYLIAQLPALTFEGSPPFDSNEFLKLCRGEMNRDDFLSLSQAELETSLVDVPAHPVLKQWRTFEYTLRSELALWRRAQRQGRSDVRPGKMIADVVTEGNPLDKEIKLMRTRWEFLDNLSVGRYFDLGTLIVYYLKLQILERKDSFNKEKGREVFDQLCQIKV